MIKKFIPIELKRKFRLLQRYYTDQKLGIRIFFAQKQGGYVKKDAHLIAKIDQPIYYNPLAANKVFNIQLAIASIQEVIVQPGEYFSFWHIVGNPTVKKGYKTGRNIIGNRLKEDVGGGLCQVSGMIYHLALVCGMSIVERYNHTLDLYEEDKRHTPLGADATVVYGHKDIRFKNNSDSAVFFKFSVTEASFSGCFYAFEKFSIATLDFRREDFEGYRTVETYREFNGEVRFINKSKYIV